MQVYLDHNSTTPVDPRVIDAMLPFFRDHYGNPGSAHALGAKAGQAVEGARQKVADLVGADLHQVLFCSSATEAINTVIHSVTDGAVVISSVEHAATRECASRLKAGGIEVIQICVDMNGALNLSMLEDALSRRPRLVSLMWANNETGVLFPIPAIADMCAAYDVLLHVDAVQAAGRIAIDLTQLPIDFLSISSHKIFGPKGVAALVSRIPDKVSPLLVGGGQERGLRAGTENVSGIVGFGEAAHLAALELSDRVVLVTELRNRLEQEILARVPGCWVNGGGTPRIGNTTNVGFSTTNGDDLVGALNGLGIAASTGSACHSRSIAPSHVITAMTGSRDKASRSVRFSLSHLNTTEEVEYTVKALGSAITLLR
jgi:cysteine desulfurase